MEVGKAGEGAEGGGGGCDRVRSGANGLQVGTEETGCCRHAVLEGRQWILGEEKIRGTRAGPDERCDTLLLFRVSFKVMTASDYDVGDFRMSCILLCM